MISVIIPTGDESKIPKSTLESIEQQKTADKFLIETITMTGPDVQVNRNRGAALARGDFLFFCDEDVTLHPQCLEIMYDALTEFPDASFAYCDYDRTGAFTGTYHSRFFDPEALKWGNFISTMSLIRKEDFPGFAEEVPRLQDWDLWLTMLENGKKGVYIAAPLFTAHFSSDGISNRGSEDYFRAVEIVKNRHPHLFPVVTLK